MLKKGELQRISLWKTKQEEMHNYDDIRNSSNISLNSPIPIGMLGIKAINQVLQTYTCGYGT
jgi:hypothetical protein